MKGKKFFALMVLGPPGSGKGTQIKMLSEKLGLFHLITSKLARDYMNSHNDIESLEQRKRYATGLLCEPKWILKIVEEKVAEIFNDEDECGGIIFDGSPRTLYEAKNLYQFLVDLIDKQNIKIIEIDVAEDELKKRLQKRLICGRSADHVFIRDEKLQPGLKCPECDGILAERDLDSPELFETRISEYKNETMPGLRYLERERGVFKVNGTQSIENVHKEIMRKLKL